MSETSQRNLGSTSSWQRCSSTTADSASTSSGVGSIASSSGPPDSNDAGDSGSHLITIENSDATNGIHHGAAPIIPITPNSVITPASNNSPGQSSDPNDEDLESDQRTLDRYRPLRQAVTKGDWPAAKAFLDKDNDCVRASIATYKATALHIAVAHQHTTFIKKWLELRILERGDMELKTNYGFTALHTAAQVGNVSIAKQLVIKNNELPSIIDHEGDTPLIVAAYIGQTNMVSYLFSVTPHEQFTKAKRIELLGHTIRNDMYDISLKILKLYPNIANADTECWREGLETLAKKPFSIGSERELSFWKSLLKYSC